MRWRFYLAAAFFEPPARTLTGNVEQEQSVLRTEEDVEAVLRLAVRNEGVAGTADLRARLEATAAELGLSREALDAAEAQYRRDLEAKAQEERRALAWKKHQLDRARSFFSHVASYVAVNAGLFAMDFLGDGRVSWAFWPLVGWGIGILSDAASTFFPSEETRRKFERREARRAASRQGESSTSSEPSSTR